MSVGWTGPYPVLSKSRPTASLVSRKVLTPLLGQIGIAFILQFISFELVKAQPWFIPPVVDENKSNITNSPNTTLFLFSCYQYIFSAIILSVGPPFRQPMTQNCEFTCSPSLAPQMMIQNWIYYCIATGVLIFDVIVPFMATILGGLMVATWMLFATPDWLFRLMQLTPMPTSFKILLFFMGLVQLGIGGAGEQYVLPKLAKGVGILKEKASGGKGKDRKMYKVLEEEMRV